MYAAAFVLIQLDAIVETPPVVLTQLFGATGIGSVNCPASSAAVGTVNVWEVPGYRIEMSPFGGIKDSGLGYKEGVVEAMKSFTNVKTYSLPWPA